MSLASLWLRLESRWPFGSQEVVCIREPSATTCPLCFSRIPVVHGEGLLERAHSWCRGNVTAALLKDLARCVERNEKPWNAIPLGSIHHCATAGSSEGLPQTSALSACV